MTEDFQNLEIKRLCKVMGQKLADLPQRLKAAQEAEHEAAELEGRNPREVKVEPIVEVPVDVLDAVLQKGKPAGGDAAEISKVYALSVKRNKVLGVKTINVRADQLAIVFEAAGFKAEAPSEVV